MTPADDIEDPSPGLARERTDLAWTRTAISFAALGGVILKNHLYEGIPVLILSALIWQLGRLASGPEPGAGRARGRRLLVIAVAVTGVSVVALVISLLGPQSGGLRL